MICRTVGCKGKLTYKLKTTEVITYSIQFDKVDFDKEPIDHSSKYAYDLVQCSICGKLYEFEGDDLGNDVISITLV